MNNAFAVDVGDSEAELTKDATSLGLCKALVFDQVVVELAARTELADPSRCTALLQ